MSAFKDMANTWVSGLVTYEAGRPIDEVARELGFESASEIIKLASNENALGPSPAAIKAMHSAANEVHRYPDGGCYYLRQRLADVLNIAPECILPANGSNEVIELLGHAFLAPDSDVVVADTSFIVYRLVAMASRATTISVPMQKFVHDLDAMLAAITPRTQIVFVSNPNNPTGTAVEPGDFDRFMEAAPSHVVVCLDEAYVELLDESKRIDSLRYVREGRNLVVMRTFSKVYGLAGLRVGYAVAPPDCIALLQRVRQPFNVNSMAQGAALAALDDVEHVANTRRVVKEGLAYLQGELDRMDISYVPSVANFILLKVGNGRAVFEELQRRGVIVRPMDVYGLPDYVRVTVGLRAENERFVRGLAGIRR